ncbi:tetratricopeptide repeat protein [Yinghuangia soli]|uniref:Tetratricopeptide repeat protein n=1 Tax=Yinghuangia soli TaxID=2908204 RepID=A0AA41Q0Z7_9ACTN|nr:tetratricopeptide repeat protein [Yinghuangia soli]MCF2528459.1 tetratricopeptide repeat protein [Yinghuangia soli]
MSRDTLALVTQAGEAWDEQDWPRAAELYEELLTAEPHHERSEQWAFDAALAHKFLRDWPKAYALGKEAAARAEPGTGDPAFWNLGIAATALGVWDVARESWQAYGIDLKPGVGEITEDFGLTCVRLATPDGREIVWAKRICPARAIVVNVPLSSAHRFGDIVLHDGVPNGERVVEGNAFPVFDELMVWRTSGLPTWTVDVTAPTADDFAALEMSFAGRNLGVEAASAVRTLCACCDEGSVEQVIGSGHGVGVQVRIAAPEADAALLLASWQRESEGRSWENLAPVTAAG